MPHGAKTRYGAKVVPGGLGEGGDAGPQPAGDLEAGAQVAVVGGAGPALAHTRQEARLRRRVHEPVRTEMEGGEVLVEVRARVLPPGGLRGGVRGRTGQGPGRRLVARRFWLGDGGTFGFAADDGMAELGAFTAYSCASASGGDSDDPVLTTP